MRTYHLLFTLLALTTISNCSFTQLKDFPEIFITTSENSYLDLNDYFEGNISNFTASPPLFTNPKFTQISSYKDILRSPNDKIVSVLASKDIFGNWIPNDTWFFLDNNNTLSLFNYTASGLSKLAEFPFISTNPDAYTCGEMLLLDNQSLIISCSQTVNPVLWKTSLFVLNPLSLNPTDPIITSNAFDSTVRSLKKFPGVDNFVIAYSPCNVNKGVNLGSFVTIYDLTSQSPVIDFTATNFGLNFFCLTDLAVVNQTIFFADYVGYVYAIADPINSKPLFSYQLIIDDNILKMTAVHNNYQGQVTTTIVIESDTYIYYYDWTDITRKPVLKNKFSIPNGSPVQEVKYLEVSQDFASTVVNRGGIDYLYSYYLKQTQPGNIYYQQSFQTPLSFIDSSRPQNLFLFGTVDSVNSTFSLNISQLQRSLLKINSTTTGTYNGPLSIDGNVAANISVLVIDSASPQVYIQETNESFALNASNGFTFNITDLFNGPLITYRTNDTRFEVLPIIENVTVNQNITLNLTNPYAFYSGEDSDSIYFFEVSDDSDGNITVYKCEGSKFNCSESTIQGAPITTMAANDQYLFFYSNWQYSIEVIDYTNSSSQVVPLMSNSPNCNQLLVSQVPGAPFLYCGTLPTIYVMRTDVPPELLVFYSWTYPNNPPATPNMKISSKFPSILFTQDSTTIYLIDSYALTLAFANPIISTIVVPGIDSQGFNFSIGGQSLLVLRYYDLTLLEYDISHPQAPVLIKTLPSAFYMFNQFLSDSQNSDNIYIYAQSLVSAEPVALVYKPQRTGNSNYWAQIPLPNPPFDPSNPDFVPPVFPGIRKQGGYELFLLPNGQQLGWKVQSEVQAQFNETGSSSNDYEVIFAGTFESNSAMVQAKVNVTVASEEVMVVDNTSGDYGFELDDEMMKEVNFESKGELNFLPNTNIDESIIC